MVSTGDGDGDDVSESPDNLRRLPRQEREGAYSSVFGEAHGRAAEEGVARHQGQSAL